MLEKIRIDTVEERDYALEIYKTAKNHGLVIKTKIQNPKDNELAYYYDILGIQFKHSPHFIKEALEKWLPGLKVSIRQKMANLIYDGLEKMRLGGKNENMLQNAYIKLMCWFYYRFMGILLSLESNRTAAIICSENLSDYELTAFEILSNLGCKVFILAEADIQSLESEYKRQKYESDKKLTAERLCGGSATIEECVNIWMKGDVFSQIKLSCKDRGADENLYYSVFCSINGVDDKDTYERSLFEFYSELMELKRKIVIVNNRIEPPNNDEIAIIKRKNDYKDFEEMLNTLVANLDFAHKEIRLLMRRAYIKLFEEQAKRTDISSAKLQSKMVYLLCWIKRYEKELFAGFNFEYLPVFIKMGASNTKTEALFIWFLSMLPVDVIIFKPDLQCEDLIKDKRLYEITFEQSMQLSTFPLKAKHTTAAYNAQIELSEILYQGSGIYRDRQYVKANSVVLSTMMEEIELLWDEPLKFRQGFAEDGEILNLPTIFAKLSGVPNANVSEYWSRFGKLVVEDSVVVLNPPYINPLSENPIKPFVTQFFKNNRLDKEKIKSHKNYDYTILRQETQEHILSKLEVMIKDKLIAGIGENGTEYTVISVVLNLPKEVIRLIQKFDFTKKNPKLIYVNTGEQSINLEDSILSVFLNLIGFDVIFLVPTGYQSIEKYFSKNVVVEHQIGEYLYDLEVPKNFGVQTLNNGKKSWRDFFGLGGK